MSDLRLPDINRVFVAGRLGHAPELRHSQDGTPVCEFSVAISKRWKTKDGETKEKTIWMRVEAWAAKQDPDLVLSRMPDGAYVGVVTQLCWEAWQAADASAVMTHEPLVRVCRKVTAMGRKHPHLAGLAENALENAGYEVTPRERD